MTDKLILFKNKQLLNIVKEQFQLNIDGEHGVEHWNRVYQNTLLLADYYNIQSDVFELFALLHDSKRLDELEDLEHGKRAAIFVKELIKEKLIHLTKEDENRLIFACSNHTVTNTKAKLFNDMIVQICFDADRLDIGRVGIIPEEKYFYTNYAKSLIKQKNYYYPF